MSKPRYFWYGGVRSSIQHYGELSTAGKEGQEYKTAIDKAFKDIEEKPEAAAIKYAIEAVLIKQTHTIEGAAMVTYYSRRTVQRWINDFIYRVGRYKGYKTGR